MLMELDSISLQETL